MKCCDPLVLQELLCLLHSRKISGHTSSNLWTFSAPFSQEQLWTNCISGRVAISMGFLGGPGFQGHDLAGTWELTILGQGQVLPRTSPALRQAVQPNTELGNLCACAKLAHTGSVPSLQRRRLREVTTPCPSGPVNGQKEVSVRRQGSLHMCQSVRAGAVPPLKSQAGAEERDHLWAGEGTGHTRYPAPWPWPTQS